MVRYLRGIFTGNRYHQGLESQNWNNRHGHGGNVDSYRETHCKGDQFKENRSKSRKDETGSKTGFHKNGKSGETFGDKAKVKKLTKHKAGGGKKKKKLSKVGN